MIYSVLAFVLGAIVGSFLNVCIYRLPKNESIAFPVSHCSRCQKPVRWYDNVPVISYLVLRGKCRDCGVSFSIQYPLIEILTGALFVLFYRFFGFSPMGAIYLVLALALLVESMIDFRYKIIPDEITLPGIVMGIIFSGWTTGFFDSVIGVLVGGGVLYLIGVVAERILKKEAMGGGDVKLLAMIGAYLGVRGVLWTFLIGPILGLVPALYFKAIKKEEEVPFGPFLGLAAFLYIFFGSAVIDWYVKALQF